MSPRHQRLECAGIFVGALLGFAGRASAQTSKKSRATKMHVDAEVYRTDGPSPASIWKTASSGGSEPR